MVATSKEIIKQAKACLKENKNSVSAKVALGVAHFEKGELEKAEKFYFEALQLDKASAEANAGLGMVYARKKHTEESIKYLSKALKLAPDCGILANWLADAYFDLGQLETAIEYYGIATRINSHDSNAHNDMADAYRLKGLFDKAIEHYERTIELDPLDTNAILEKAQCLLALDKEKEGCHILEELIARFSESKDAGTANVILGTIFSGKKEYHIAVSYFERALKFFPFDTKVLFQLGLAYEVIKEKEKADNCFQKILDLDPSDKKVKALLQKVRK